MRLPETWMVPLAAELVAAAAEDETDGSGDVEDMKSGEGRERDYTVVRVVRGVFMCLRRWRWWYKGVLGVQSSVAVPGAE